MIKHANRGQFRYQSENLDQKSFIGKLPPTNGLKPDLLYQRKDKLLQEHLGNALKISPYFVANSSPKNISSNIQRSLSKVPNAELINGKVEIYSDKSVDKKVGNVKASKFYPYDRTAENFKNSINDDAKLTSLSPDILNISALNRNINRTNLVLNNSKNIHYSKLNSSPNIRTVPRISVVSNNLQKPDNISRPVLKSENSKSKKIPILTELKSSNGHVLKSATYSNSCDNDVNTANDELMRRLNYEHSAREREKVPNNILLKNESCYKILSIDKREKQETKQLNYDLQNTRHCGKKYSLHKTCDQGTNVDRDVKNKFMLMPNKSPVVSSKRKLNKKTTKACKEDAKKCKTDNLKLISTKIPTDNNISEKLRRLSASHKESINNNTGKNDEIGNSESNNKSTFKTLKSKLSFSKLWDVGKYEIREKRETIRRSKSLKIIKSKDEDYISSSFNCFSPKHKMDLKHESLEFLLNDEFVQPDSEPKLRNFSPYPISNSKSLQDFRKVKVNSEKENFCNSVENSDQKGILNKQLPNVMKIASSNTKLCNEIPFLKIQKQEYHNEINENKVSVPRVENISSSTRVSHKEKVIEITSLNRPSDYKVSVDKCAYQRRPMSHSQQIEATVNDSNFRKVSLLNPQVFPSKYHPKVSHQSVIPLYTSVTNVQQRKTSRQKPFNFSVNSCSARENEHFLSPLKEYDRAAEKLNAELVEENLVSKNQSFTDSELRLRKDQINPPFLKLKQKYGMRRASNNNIYQSQRYTKFGKEICIENNDCDTPANLQESKRRSISQPDLYDFQAILDDFISDFYNNVKSNSIKTSHENSPQHFNYKEKSIKLNQESSSVRKENQNVRTHSRVGNIDIHKDMNNKKKGFDNFNQRTVVPIKKVKLTDGKQFSQPSKSKIRSTANYSYYKKESTDYAPEYYLVPQFRCFSNYIAANFLCTVNLINTRYNSSKTLRLYDVKNNRLNCFERMHCGDTSTAEKFSNKNFISNVLLHEFQCIVAPAIGSNIRLRNIVTNINTKCNDVPIFSSPSVYFNSAVESLDNELERDSNLVKIIHHGNFSHVYQLYFNYSQLRGAINQLSSKRNLCSNFMTASYLCLEKDAHDFYKSRHFQSLYDLFYEQNSLYYFLLEKESHTNEIFDCVKEGREIGGINQRNNRNEKDNPRKNKSLTDQAEKRGVELHATEISKRIKSNPKVREPSSKLKQDPVKILRPLNIINNENLNEPPPKPIQNGGISSYQEFHNGAAPRHPEYKKVKNNFLNQNGHKKSPNIIEKYQHNVQIQQKTDQNKHQQKELYTRSHIKQLEDDLLAKKKELQKLTQGHRSSVTSVQALAVLIQYLTTECDAFATEKLKKENAHLNRQIEDLKSSLDENRFQLTNVNTRLAETQRDHQNALEEVKNEKFAEVEIIASEHRCKLESVAENHQKEIENILSLESSKSKELHFTFTRKEDGLLRQNENLNCEVEILKSEMKNLEQSLLSDKDHRLQAAKRVCDNLQKEVDSLKSVLDMRNSELHKLRDQIVDKDRISEDLDATREKVRSLKAKSEDLEAQLQTKCQIERNLISDHRTITELLQRESLNLRRLTLENEQLQWKLRQKDADCSPRHVAPRYSGSEVNKLGSATFGEQSLSIDASVSNKGNSVTGDNNADTAQTSADWPSETPLSPKVKGVVEKSNSVSFILDLDDNEESLLENDIEQSFLGNNGNGQSFLGDSSPSNSFSRGDYLDFKTKAALGKVDDKKLSAAGRVTEQNLGEKIKIYDDSRLNYSKVEGLKSRSDNSKVEGLKSRSDNRRIKDIDLQFPDVVKSSFSPDFFTDKICEKENSEFSTHEFGEKKSENLNLDEIRSQKNVALKIGKNYDFYFEANDFNSFLLGTNKNSKNLTNKNSENLTNRSLENLMIQEKTTNFEKSGKRESESFKNICEDQNTESHFSIPENQNNRDHCSKLKPGDPSYSKVESNFCKNSNVESNFCKNPNVESNFCKTSDVESHFCKNSKKFSSFCPTSCKTEGFPRFFEGSEEDEYSENEFVEVLSLEGDLNSTAISSLFIQTPSTSVSFSASDFGSRTDITTDSNSDFGSRQSDFEKSNSESDSDLENFNSSDETTYLQKIQMLCRPQQDAGESMVQPDSDDPTNQDTLTQSQISFSSDECDGLVSETVDKRSKLPSSEEHGNQRSNLPSPEEHRNKRSNLPSEEHGNQRFNLLRSEEHGSQHSNLRRSEELGNQQKKPDTSTNSEEASVDDKNVFLEKAKTVGCSKTLKTSPEKIKL